MSKWFSARSRFGALVLAVLAFAGACTDDAGKTDGKRRRSQTVTESDLRFENVAQAEPGVERHNWSAAGPKSREITGKLTVSLEAGRGGPVVFAFATGVTVRAEELETHGGDARVGVGDESFQSMLSLPADVRSYVYRVLNQNVAESARRGGLCGGRDTPPTHVAVAEFVDEESGLWVMRIAAFRGSTPPGARGAPPESCGVFQYQQPN